MESKWNVLLTFSDWTQPHIYYGTSVPLLGIHLVVFGLCATEGSGSTGLRPMDTICARHRENMPILQVVWRFGADVESNDLEAT